MNIIIDSREVKLIEVIELIKKDDNLYNHIQIITKPLEVADIIIQSIDDSIERILIERKTVSDLIASFKDNRYTEQSFRLNGYPIFNHYIYYLIEGNIKSDKKSVLSSFCSLTYLKGFSLLRTFDIHETALLLLQFACKMAKNVSKNGFYENKNEEIKTYTSVVKKKKNDNVNVDNFGEIILCQIPSVNSVTAIAIMKEYKTINNLIDTIKTNPNCLDKIVTQNNRKISKTCIKNIVLFLQEKKD
jgi:ERCC4-type nuclease